MTDDGQQTKNDHGGTEPNPGGASSRRAPPTIDLKSSDYSESPSPSSTKSSSDSANQATSGRANVLHQYAVPAIAGAIAALVVAGPLMMAVCGRIDLPRRRPLPHQTRPCWTI